MCEKFTLAKSLMMIIACCSTYYLFMGQIKKIFLQKIVIRHNFTFKNSRIQNRSQKNSHALVPLSY